MHSSVAVPTQSASASVTTMGSRSLRILVLILMLLFVAAAVIHFWLYPRIVAPSFDTPYQAVLLNNGAVYFGQLSHTWSPYPILKDVYYLQSVTNKETNQTSNVLIKRGKEWHGPDYMVLSSRNIVLIEPVGPSSKVAQLIAESKQQK